MAALTPQHLEDAGRDAEDLGSFVNTPSGTVTTRLGQEYPTVGQLISDLQATANAVEGETAVVVCAVTGASTNMAIVVAPLEGAVTTYSSGVIYWFTPVATNSAAGPTLKIGDGPVRPFVDAFYNTMQAGELIPGRLTPVSYETASGGYFRLATELMPDRPRTVVVTNSDANAITAVSVLVPQLRMPRPYQRFTLRLTGDVTVPVPTLSVDGLPAKGIYDITASLVDPSLLRAGSVLELQWTLSFGGVWLVLSPRAPAKGAAAAMEGIQRADESAAGLRSMREELKTLGVIPTVALDPAPVYDTSFATLAEAQKFFTAKGNGPNTAYVETPLSHNAASGGYAISSAVATPGADSWWWDWNHVYPGPGMLQLLAVANSLSNSSTAPLPNIADLRNCRVTFDLEAVGLYLPAGAHLMFHWQGYDLTVANGGTGRAINFQWHEALDVRLGSRGLGKGWPGHRNSGTGTLLNGRATFTIDFVPNDAYWRCIGTSEGRIATYAAAPVERVMRAATVNAGQASSFANMHIQVVHPQQWGATTDGIPEKVPPIERAYGEIRLHSWKVEKPA